MTATCDSIGCDNPGFAAKTRSGVRIACVECRRSIVRCGSCWHRFLQVNRCVRCTGYGVSTRPNNSKPILEPSPWRENAVRLLEDGGAA